MSGAKCLVILQIFVCAFIRLSLQDLFVGDSFPTCIEVVDVQPPPGSMLNTTEVNFTITFSRYVSYIPRPFLKDVQSKSIHLRFPPVFLTSTPVEFDFIRGTFKFHAEINKILATFHIQEELEKPIPDRRTDKQVRRSTDIVHLVVGGGLFGFEDTFYKNTYYRMVPMTVIGKYYLNKNKKPQNVVPTPIVPSLYCRPRQRRPLPDPYFENRGDNYLSFDIEIPSAGHVLEEIRGKYEVQLSLTMKGNGSDSIVLPTTIIAEIEGVNVTVALPETKLFCKKKDLYFKIPVDSEIVHEVIERIYNRIHYHHTYFSRKGFTKPPSDIVGFNAMYKDRLWTAEFSIAGTKDSLLRPYSMKYSRYRGSIEQAEYFGEFSLAAEVLHPEQEDLLDLIKNKNNPHYHHRKEKDLFDRNKYDFGHSSQSMFSGRRSNVYKQCPDDSPRTRQSGRQGTTYHVMEYGPLYRLVIPDENVDNWEAKTETKIELIDKNGNRTDITSNLKFNGQSQARIPSSLYQDVMKYAILLQAKSELSGPVQTALDEGIYVPRSEGLSQSCGGIQLFKKITSITKDEQFCEKRFGDCVGYPFTSLDRYPVIPPFGMPELAGWTTTDETKMPRKESLQEWHPIGRHITKDRIIPRSIYRASKKDGRWLYLAAPESTTTDVRGITINGVHILEPDFGLDSFDACSTLRSFKSLLHDKARQNDGILTISLNNRGLGGVHLTVAVRCSEGLFLLPHPPQLQRWVHPNEQIKLTMELSGSSVVQVKRMVHECLILVNMRVLPGMTKIGQRLECPMRLTTHYGAFENPCTTKIKAPLPELELDYYILPQSQMGETKKNVDRLLESPAGRRLTFVKAITLIVDIPSHHRDLLSNLHELKISCKTNKKNTLVLTEQQLQQRTDLQAVQQTTKKPLSYSTIRISSEFTKSRRLFFFLDKKWYTQIKSKNLTESKYASQCSIEVLAGKNHPLCDKLETLTQLPVLLVQADLTALLKQDENDMFLKYLYGDLTDEMYVAMHAIIITGIVLLVLAVIGHVILYAFSDQLSSRDKVLKLKRELKQAKSSDTRKWENPQMYITKGSQGPYYRLHNFKATDALDTKKLSSLKIAGMLKYKEKELQVVFGHVKAIFVSTKETNGDIWLQASSGMYKLQFKDVNDEYIDSLKSMLRRHGVRPKSRRRGS